MSEVFQVKRLLIVGAVCFLLGTAAGWGMRKPVVKIEERIVTKTETKWRTNETIRTLPGAIVYRDKEGDMTITGPVEITATRSGEEHITNDINRKSESCPPPPDYTVAGGAQWDYNGVVSYGGVVGRRLVGPVWGYAGVFAPPVRVAALVGVTF